jgi:uncharacterized protein YqfA (UPF0365 family)
MTSGQIIFLTVAGLFILLMKVFPTAMYFTTKMAGTPISFMDLLSMKYRKVDVNKIGNSYIQLRKANIDIKLRDLETAYLTKHDLVNITRGLITSKMKNIPMTLEQAKEADKKGINIMAELNKATD